MRDQEVQQRTSVGRFKAAASQGPSGGRPRRAKLAGCERAAVACRQAATAPLDDTINDDNGDNKDTDDDDEDEDNDDGDDDRKSEDGDEDDDEDGNDDADDGEDNMTTVIARENPQGHAGEGDDNDDADADDEKNPNDEGEVKEWMMTTTGTIPKKEDDDG